MASIKEITYDVTASIKIREFEYCKPKIAITISLDKDDDESVIFDELTETLRHELKKEIKQLKRIL